MRVVFFPFSAIPLMDLTRYFKLDDCLPHFNSKSFAFHSCWSSVHPLPSLHCTAPFK